MIISGLEIKNMLNKEIFIEPFDDSRLNPNSYNLRLHNELLVYDSHVLDMKVKNETKTISIPPEGLVLEPGIVYLGRTVEYTKTLNHVPMLEGRSSIGRLGIYIHVTAGFGDVGFSGYWTLEISCIQPVRIYPFSSNTRLAFRPSGGCTQQSASIPLLCKKTLWRDRPATARIVL